MTVIEPSQPIRPTTIQLKKEANVQSQVVHELPLVSSSNALKKVEQTGTKVSLGDEQMIKKIERALKAMQGPDTSFEMSVHEATNAVMIKVINKETGEIIREVPPEKTLDVVAKFMEINGILIDKKV